MLRGLNSRPFLAVAIASIWTAGMLAFAMTREKPIGSVAGRVIGADTGKPISGASVRLTRQGNAPEDDWETKSIETDAKGDYKFSNIPAGVYDIEAAAKVHGLKPSKVVVREGTVDRVNLELQPGDPYFNLYIHEQTFTSNEAPEIVVDGFTVEDDITLDIYRVDPDKLFTPEATSVRRMLTDNWGSSYDGSYENNPALASRETRTVPIANRDSEGTYHQRINLGRQQPGMYIITASVGNIRKTGWVSVSDIGLIIKEGGADLLACAVRPDSGRPVPGVQVSVLEGDQTVGSGVTGSDGTWRGQPTKRKDTGRQNRMIVGRLAGSMVIVTSYSYEPESSDTSIYAYTDRPIYRPGQRVHFRGIVRKFAGDSYQMPPQGEARVEVRDRRDTLIYAKSLPMSRFGSFHDGFKLPEYAATGGYDVTCSFGGQDQTISFSVAEYRKPEFSVTVEMPKKRCVRGEKIKAKVRATYFFGAPVVGAEVRYSVSRSGYWFWPDEEDSEYYEGEYEDYGDYGEPQTEGTVRTGPDGTAEVEFVAYWPQEKDVYYSNDQRFTVSADVTDPSRSTASGDGSIIATQGEFALNVEPEQYVVQTGSQTRIRIVAEDYGHKPVAGVNVDVTANLVRWDRDSDEERFQRVAGSTIRTNARGEAAFAFRPAKAGSYVIHVKCRDGNGNEIRGADYVWVTGEGEVEEYGRPRLQVVLDKKEYNPGDTARVMINSQEKDADVLLTVEGRRLYEYRMVKLSGGSAVADIPVRPEYRPNFYISACYVRKKQIQSQQARARVSLVEQTITLAVTPDKRKYEPGDTAIYTVKALDNHGKPLRAEVSLGVVDEAIYQIQEDDTTPIRDFFYRRQPNSVNTRDSFAHVYLSGDKAGFTGKVRKEFLDTAYWRADVVTDAKGEARVSVKLPDNLTTWRATARACTMDTAVGQTVSSVISTKRLLVRLETPRFLVQKDRVLVSALVHNYTSGDQDVKVALRAPGLKLEGRQTRQVTVDRDGMQRVEWWVTASNPGDVTITAYAVGTSAQDAMQLTIPVRPSGQREVETRVGTLTGSSTFEKLMIRSDSTPGGSEIRIRLAPSLASSLLGSLDYLAEYPYGCTEQTMSCFLPDVVIWRTLKSLNMPNPDLEKRLPDMVGRGLNRLYDFQNENGGWGWVGYGNEDLWMTSYVIYGLLTARSAGFAVNEDILNNGISHLASKLTEQTKVTPEVIYATYVASLAGKHDVARERLQFILRKPVTQPHDLALVTLTFANIGEQETAKHYLLSLWDKAILSGRSAGTETRHTERSRSASDQISHTERSRSASDQIGHTERSRSASGDIHWEDRRNWYYDDTPTETTALAMMAVLKVTPDDPRLAQIMRWIMGRRIFNHWYSTRDTAMILYAASEYLLRTKELHPNYGVTVLHNGTEIAGARMDQNALFTPEKEIVIRPRDVRKGGNVIRLVKNGTGVLYYTIEAVQYVEREQRPKTVTGSGITVSREYRKFVSRWNENLRYNELQPANRTATSFKSGDILQVRLIVNSPGDYEHVMVEDYLPAGCEAFDRGRVEPWEWDYWWNDIDVRDSRVTFYVETLQKGRNVLDYQMRAWIPGKYHAPGTLVQAMYDPSIVAIGVENVFQIGEK